MNNTITIYELLGLIKEGKAPKKIKLHDRIYTYVCEDPINEYYDYQDEYREYLFCDMTISMSLTEILNNKVEILKEDKPIIEKITINENHTIEFPNGKWTARNMDIAFAVKINQIIDYINRKEDKNN